MLCKYVVIVVGCHVMVPSTIKNGQQIRNSICPKEKVSLTCSSKGEDWLTDYSNILAGELKQVTPPSHYVLEGLRRRAGGNENSGLTFFLRYA